MNLAPPKALLQVGSGVSARAFRRLCWRNFSIEAREPAAPLPPLDLWLAVF